VTDTLKHILILEHRVWTPW